MKTFRVTYARNGGGERNYLVVAEHAPHAINKTKALLGSSWRRFTLKSIREEAE